MLTAEKVIKEIYLLPLNERQKVARHIIEFGIRVPHPDVPEILDMKAWQDEIARKPFNLKQASEYLGVFICYPQKMGQSRANIGL